MLKTDNLPVVWVVFGPQGSGKTTQVERLAERYGLKIFEVGKILRARAKIDEKLQRNLNQGTLVDNATILGIVDDFISKQISPNGYVFDGYPRNSVQFNDLITLQKKYGWQVAAIFINLSDGSVKQRLSTRFRLIDGQKIIRDDDKPEIIEKRLDNYKKETLPLRERFAETFQLLEIDGEPPVANVTAQINTAVDRFFNAKS